MNTKTILGYVPFAIAALRTIWCFIEVHLSAPSVNAAGEPTDYYVLLPVKLAAVGLVLIAILIVMKNKYWKYAFVVLLFLAMARLVHFSSTTYTFNFGFGKEFMEGGIEYTAFLLLLAHVYLNKEILEKIKGTFKQTEKEKEVSRKSKTNRFEIKFKLKSTEELHRIVQDSGYTAEAIEAAKRILNHR